MCRLTSIVLCVLCVLLSLPCVAAVNNAVVYGTVYNLKGEPMPGVTVVLERPADGARRVTITGPNGSYTIAEVPPADGYRLTGILAGRKIDIREGITVNVGDERVVLPPLHEQSQSEPVKAVSAGERVQNETVSAASSAVITRAQLATLPLYNRNFLALGLLAPNTHDVEAGSALAGATFSIAGARPVSNNFLLDGSDNVASGTNQVIPFQVNDSIQEFRVTSAAAGAEYGRNLGGVVNVVTRRGSNQFHGSAFGFFGSDSWNATNPLSVYNGTTFRQAANYAGSTHPAVPNLDEGWYPSTYNDYAVKAHSLGYCTTPMCENTYFDPAAILRTKDSHTQPFDSKQFGINMGGAPVKDRFFLFGSYEGTRIDNPNPIFERVPTAFDKTYNYYGVSGFAFDQTDPNYQFAQKVLSLYPKSNVVAVPNVLEFYRGQAPNYTDVDNYFLRTDLVQSDRSSLTFRYNAQRLNQLHDSSLPASAAYAGNGAVRDALNQNFSAAYMNAIGPRMTNEARIGFTRFRVDESPQDPATAVASALGLASGSLLPTFSLSGIDHQYSGATPDQYGAVSSWAHSYWNQDWEMSPTLDGYFPYARIGAPLTAPSLRRDTTVLLSDAISVSSRKHALKIGAEYRNQVNGFENGAFSRGMVFSSNLGEFTSDSEADSWNGIGPYGFATPSFNYALRQSSAYQSSLHSRAVSWFVQDTWRVHPRLSVTMGLRYDYFSVPSEQNNNLWNYDPAANGLVKAGSAAVVAPDGTSCASTRSSTFIFSRFAYDMPWGCRPFGNGSVGADNTRNFAPRLGIAWDLSGTGKTVLRFGAGWYYDQRPASDVAQLMYNRPTPLSLKNPQMIYGQTFGFIGDTAVQLASGNTTLNPANPAYSPEYQAAASPMAITAIDASHSGTPYSRQLNFSLQQQITPKLVVEAGYIGAFASNLPVITNSYFSREWRQYSTRRVTADRADDVPVLDGLGPVFTLTNQGHSNYNSLLLRVRGAEWHGLRVNATYNYSRSMDNASTSVFPVLPITGANLVLGPQLWGLGNPYNVVSPTSVGALNPGLTTTGAGATFSSGYSIPQDPIHFLKDDYGRSDFDAKHKLILDYSWQVPSLHDAIRLPKVLDDWNVSGVLSVHSGQPFTIFAGPILGEMTQRVNVTGPVQLTGDPNGYIGTRNLALASETCGAFRTDSDGNMQGACTGNSARNAFVGPGYASMDLAVQKTFRIAESRSLIIRAESFNTFNHANYYNPISTLSLDGNQINPEFGKILSAHSPRQIQLAVRFNW